MIVFAPVLFLLVAASGYLPVLIVLAVRLVMLADPFVVLGV